MVIGSVSNRIPVRNLALADTSKLVSITADGQNKVVTTDAGTVGEVLGRAHVQIAPGDLVEPDVSTALPHGFFNINVYRSQLYRVVDGNKATLVRSAQQAPRLIAADASTTVYPEDEVHIDKVTDFVSDGVVGQNVIITRATEFHLVADGETKTLRSQAATIGAALSDKKVPLGAKDTVSPAPDTGLVKGTTVHIVRVADAVVTKDEVLPKSVQTVTDASLPKGSSNVKTEGSDGKRTVTYKVHYKDGLETARETLSITGQVEPVAKVVVQGTKVSFQGSVEYWRPYVTDAAAANGVDPNLMLAIMNCESHGNANATNGVAFGLFQFLRPTWESYGLSFNDIYDGKLQIQVAASRLAKGTSPWYASKACWGNAY
jgi:uncharacterized protein YabE (DUF348 family)